jgi:hypothetical protein
MPGNTLFSIGEALIDMIPSRVGCAFDEVPSFSPHRPMSALPLPVWAVPAAFSPSWAMTPSATKSHGSWKPAAST